MNKKSKFFLPLLTALAVGCTTNDVVELTNDAKTPSAEEVADAGVVPGMLRIKVSPNVVGSLNIQKVGSRVSSGDESIDAYLKSIGATSIEPLFTISEKYKKRAHEAGLHLWYQVKFDEKQPISRAANEAESVANIDYVEKVWEIATPKYTFTPISSVPQSRANTYPFDDTYLPNQWHYINYGNIGKDFTKGADINLAKAWEIETGKPNVIVSVVDGGVDYTHEDLKDNMWINSGEIPNNGRDDDGNGFVDDIYGYNFVFGGKVVAGAHGTHVAGTVAARNNNGIGVAGVAGGDGSRNSGVRLMSCEIFETGSDGRDVNGNSPKAIVYGADNGAVISQNSWGYTYPGVRVLPSSVKTAIDYFIKYAGCDEDGNQRPDSPMKGGVVIFAAGNDDAEYLAYPAAYSEVVSVTAMAPDFKRAYYSNRGDWASIFAPGGDAYYGTGQTGMVASTYPNNRYGYMQGTSMACPHVSGVAALVVSKFGGPGFTNEMLKKRLKNSINAVDIYDTTLNSNYRDKLGTGLIDAAAALRDEPYERPEKVSSVTASTTTSSATLKFKAVHDEDNGTASKYRVYYSKSKLDKTALPYTQFLMIDAAQYEEGDLITARIKDLVGYTTYYMAIVAVDNVGLRSEPTFFTIKTDGSDAEGGDDGDDNDDTPIMKDPVLTLRSNEAISLKKGETKTVIVDVKVDEATTWTASLKGTGRSFVKSAYKYSNYVEITLEGGDAAGDYELQLTVTDGEERSSQLTIKFAIAKNDVPGPDSYVITGVKTVPSSTDIRVYWNPLVVNNVESESYVIYWSSYPLDADNFRDARSYRIYSSSKDANGMMNCRMKNMEPGQKLYFALTAKVGDDYSRPVFFSEQTTKEEDVPNTAPVLTRRDNEKIVLASGESKRVYVDVKDAEGDAWSYDLSGDKANVSATKSGSSVELLISGNGTSGSYAVTLSVTDAKGAKSSISVPYTIENKPSNSAPEITGESSYKLTPNTVKEVSYRIYDADGDSWTYELVGAASGITATKGYGRVYVKFNGVTRSGQFTLKVTDSEGNISTKVVSYEVMQSSGPVLAKDFSALSIAYGRRTTFNLDDYFTSPSGSSLNYRVQSYGISSVGAFISNSNQLILTGYRRGSTYIIVEARDTDGNYIKQTVKVTVE